MKQKPEKEKLDNEPRYRFREVVCPLCDHKFMVEWQLEGRAGIEGDEREYFSTVCPKCSEKMLVCVDEARAVLEADIEKGRLRRHFCIR